MLGSFPINFVSFGGEFAEFLPRTKDGGSG